MAKLSVKVVVAGRTYPLSVSEDEQDKVLKAAEDINKAIKLLQDNYAVKDMQDLLAMTALQLASKSDGKKATDNKNSKELDDIQKKLEDLLNDLDA
ncbi:MAG: cell division protein ZapA [Crocinitomicaceae bacterium]|nr:cell division protein ZapA [Crocinitomicaceae bacterium]